MATKLWSEFLKLMLEVVMGVNNIEGTLGGVKSQSSSQNSGKCSKVYFTRVIGSCSEYQFARQVGSIIQDVVITAVRPGRFGNNVFEADVYW